MADAEEAAVEQTSNKVDLIIAEALTWLGTPYHEQASVKGPNGGIDCAMFICRVFVDSGVIAPFDPRPYSDSFFLHRDEPLYLQWVERYADKLSDGVPEAPGDLALFKLGRTIAHSGIYLGDDLIIHAWKQAGAVVKSELRRSPAMLKMFQGFWRIRQ